jgi:hypothetical protein
MRDKRSLEDRFWSRVRKDDEGCWRWVGSCDEFGYPRFAYQGRGTGMAYRYSYELHNGPVPEGLELDHLCRVRDCVNPAHLEAVTHRENCRRREAWHARHYS